MPSIISGQQLGLLHSSLNNLGVQNGDPALGQNQGQVHINAASGNLVLQHQDMIQVGLGTDINLLRTYNSLGRFQQNDAFKYNWEKRIEGTQNDRNVVVYHGDGSYSVFRKSHEDSHGKHFVSTDGDGAHETLTYANRQWTMTDGSTQTEYVFGNRSASNRKLIAILDKEGSRTDIEYTNWGDIQSIQNSGGQRVEFDYQGNGNRRMLANVMSFTNGTLQNATHYEYDDLKRMTKVIIDLDTSNARLDDNGDGILNDQSDAIYITEFHYYQPGEKIGGVRVHQHDDLIKSMRQSDGTLLSVHYVASNDGWRVKSTQIGEGDDKQVMHFDYHERRTDVTQVLDLNYIAADDNDLVSGQNVGQGITTSYIYDDKERLYRVISPADENGQRLVTSYHYDEDDNVRSVTDGRNQTTYMTYDDNGNVLSRMDASGNTETYAYDQHNQLIRSTVYRTADPDGLGPNAPSEPNTSRFIYDEKHRVRFSIDGEGRVTETRYADNEVTPGKHSDYIYSSNAFDVSALDENSDLTLAQLESWVNGLSDYSGVQRIDRYFDFRDQISQIISFSHTDAVTGEGSGHATLQRYIYDDSGRLLSSFDLANTVNWDESSDELKHTIISGAWPSGLEFQEVRYAYDGMGRLLVTTDAEHNSTQYFYGVGEELQRGTIAVTHADGLRVLTVTNSAGEIVQRLEQSQANSHYTTLSETRYFYDELGRQIGVLDPTGVLSQTIFDDVGRVIASIDGTGALIEYKYNENNLIVEQIEYSDFLNAEQIQNLIVKDADGNIVDVNHPEKQTQWDDLLTDLRPTVNAQTDRHQFYFYDASDRLTYTVDPEGGITKNIYDGAGQLINEIAFKDKQGVAAVRELLNPELELQGSSTVISVPNEVDAAAVETSQLIDGRYVSVWEQGGKIYAQMFTADGNNQGDAILVHDDDNGWEPASDPVVTHLADGGFAVFWESPDSYEWDPKPRLEWQRFYADGSKKRHNNYITGFPFYEEGRLPSVATLEDGSVVVVQQMYRRQSNFDRFGWDVHAVRLDWDSETNELGTISPNLTYGIVSFDEGHETKVDVSALDNGGFVMTWQATDGDETGIKGKRFYKDGIDNETFIDDDFFINQDTYGVQSDSSVIQLKGGEFFSVWQSVNESGESVIKARRYGADRFETFNEYTLAVDEGLTQESLPKVTEFDDGSLIVVWQSQVDGETSIRVQHLDAQGLKRHDTFTITDTDTTLTDITIESLFGNRAVINWTAINAEGHQVSKQQLLGLPKDPVIAEDWLSSGNRINHYLYDDSGLLTAFVDTEHYLTVSEYDTAGQLIQTIQFANPISDDYFDNELLTTEDLSVIAPMSSEDDRIDRFYYNNNGQQVGHLDADGYLSLTTYNGIGEIKSVERYADQIAEASRTETLENLLLMIDQTKVRTSEFTYTARKQLKQSTSEDGLVTQYQYDSRGRVIITKSFDKHIQDDSNLIRETINEYDVQGRLIHQQSPLDSRPDQKDNFFYDAAGRFIQSVDSNGLSTWNFYDKMNRITHQMNELGEVKFYEYNAFGEMTKSIVPDERLSVNANEAPTHLFKGGLITQEVKELFNTLITNNASINEQTFDRRGLLFTQTDAEQNTTHHRYNIFGEKIQLSEHKADQLFAHQLFAYNKRSELIRHVSNHQASALADLGELTKDSIVDSTLATDQQWSITAFGQIKNHTNGENELREYIYDRRGNVKEQIVNGRLINGYDYDGFSRLTSSIDGLNRVTNYLQKFREVITITAEGNENSVLSNAYGEVIKRIDGNLGKTEYSYDKQGNLILVRDAEGGEQSYLFDSENRLKTSTDSRGVTTRYFYDDASRLEKTIIDTNKTGYIGLNITQTYVFNAKGEVVSQINANNVETTFEYDKNSRLVQETVDPNGLALVKRYEYDGLGNIIRQEEGHNDASITSQDPFIAKKITTLQYDALSRLKQQEVISNHSNGQVVDRTNFEYDNKNQLLSMTRSDGESIYYQYNDRGDIIVQWDSTGLVKTMSYDNNRNLIRKTIHHTPAQYDQASNLETPIANTEYDRTTFYLYDQDNRLTLTLDPEAAVNKFIYDANNNLIETQEFATFHNGLHNSLNALIDTGHTIDASTYQQIVELIDATNLTTSDNDRHTINLYDGLNRSVLSIDGEGFLKAFEYDSEGNITHTIQYGSDINWSHYQTIYNDGALSTKDKVKSIVEAIKEDSIKNNTNTIKKDLHNFFYYDAAGRLTGSIDSLGYIDLMEYDGEGNQETSTRLSTSMGEEKFNQWIASSFILNSVDDLITAAETNRTEDDQNKTYGYDAANRLTSEINHEDSVTQWQYDSLGNLTQHITGQDGLDQAFALAKDAQKVKRTYDSEGRVLSETSFDVREENGLDVEYIASTINYLYDDVGRLIEKNNNGDRTLYFYESGSNRLTHEVSLIKVDDNGNPTTNNNSSNLYLGEVTEWTYSIFGEQKTETRYVNRIDVSDLTGGLNSALQNNRIIASDNDTTIVKTFNNNGYQISSKDAENQTVNSVYNAFGEVSQFIAQRPQSEIESNPSLSATTTAVYEYDKRGLQRHRLFDASLNNQSQWIAKVKTSQVYDAFGRSVNTIDGNGNVSTTTYDALGRVTDVTDPLGRKKTTEFDAFNRVIKEHDGLGNTTEFVFNDDARTQTVKFADGSEMTSFSNRQGETVKVIDNNGATHVYEYDRRGNLIKETNALGTEVERVIENEFDSRNLIISSTKDGYDTTFEYDSARRLIRETIDASGEAFVTTTSFDAKGNEIRRTDSDGTTTLLSYDKNNRLTWTVIDPDGAGERKAQFTHLSYDAQGNKAKEETGYLNQASISEINRDTINSLKVVVLTKETQFDSLNRRVAEIIDQQVVASYVYDKNDNVTQIIDSTGATTYQFYDEANQLVAKLSPTGSVSRFWYDAQGNNVAQVDYYQPLTGEKSLQNILQTYSSVAAKDAVTFTAFNERNNVEFVIDGQGFVEQWIYSDNQKVTQTVRYAENLNLDVNHLLGYSDNTDFLVNRVMDTAPLEAKLEELTFDQTKDHIKYKVYNERDLLEFEIDGQGFVKRHSYGLNDALEKTTRLTLPLEFNGEASIEKVREDWTTTEALAQERSGVIFYDAKGRVRFEISAYDDLGNPFITEHQYSVSSVNLSSASLIVTKNSFSDAIDLGNDWQSLSTQAFASRVSVNSSTQSLSASQTQEQHLDQLGNVVHDIRFLLNDSGDRVAAQVNVNNYNAQGYLEETYVQRFNLDVDGKVDFNSPVGAKYQHSIMTYDNQGRVEQKFTSTTTDTSGSVFVSDASVYEEDQNANIVELYGFFTAYEYDEFDNIIKETVQLTETKYLDGMPAQGRRRITDYEYDANRQVVLMTVTEQFIDQNGTLTNSILKKESYTYDAFGNEETVTVYIDPNNNSSLTSVTHMTYDTNQRLISKTEAYGTDLAATTKHYYHAAHGPQRDPILDQEPLASLWQPGYRLQSIENAKGQTTYQVTNQRGLVIANVDSEGAVTRTEYDAFGNITLAVDAEGNESRFYYDNQNQLRFSIEPNKVVTEYRYNSDDLLELTIVYAQPLTSDLNNKSFTQVKTLIENNLQGNSSNQITYQEYNSLGQMTVKVLNYDSTVSLDAQVKQTYTYNALGQQVSMTDSRGHQTYYLFDAAGREVGVIQPVDSSESPYKTIKDYDSFNRQTQIGEVGELAAEAKFLDSLGRQYVSINNLMLGLSGSSNNLRSESIDVNQLRIDSLGIQREFDGRGNLIAEKTPLGHTKYFFYNALNQQVATIDGEGYVTLMERDSLGNVTKERTVNTQFTAVSSQLRESLFDKSSMSDLVSTFGFTNVSDYREFYSVYDANQRVIETSSAHTITNYSFENGKEAQNNARTFVYDSLGNVIRRTDALGNDIRYFFNSNNQLALVVTAEGLATAFEYDAFGNQTRLVKLATPISATLTDESRLNDIALSYSSNDQSTRWVFDNLNRQTMKVVENYHYDDRSNTNINRSANAIQITHYDYKEDIDGDLRDSGMNMVTQTTVAAYKVTDSKGTSFDWTTEKVKRESSLEINTIEYDALGRKILVTSNSHNGFTSVNGWATGKIQQSTKFKYNYFNQITKEQKLDTDGSAVLTQSYDYIGSRLDESYGYQKNIAYEYDKDGNISREVDFGKMADSTFSYYDNGLLKDKVTYQINSVSNGIASRGSELKKQRMAYNAFNEVTEVYGNGVLVEQSIYDNAGRMIRSNQGDGVYRLYGYDSADNKTLEIQIKENSKWSSINDLNDLYAALDSNSINFESIKATLFAYDQDNRLIDVKEVKKSLTSSNSNWKSILENASTSTQTKINQQYDSFGNVISRTDANGNTTEWTFNALNEVLTEKKASFLNVDEKIVSSPTTHYYYDGQGRQVAMRDARNNLTQKTWALDKVIQVDNADGSKFIYRYDALGELREEIKQRKAENDHEAGIVDFRRQYVRDYSKSSEKITNYNFTVDEGQFIQGRTKVNSWYIDKNNHQQQNTTSILSRSGNWLRSETTSFIAHRLSGDTGLLSAGTHTLQSYQRLDALGRVATARKFDGSVTTNGYSYYQGGFKKLSTLSNPGGGISYRAEWTDYHDRMVKKGLLSDTSSTPNKIVIKYNGFGIVDSKLGGGTDIEYQYDRYGRKTKMLNRTLKAVTDYEYDKNGNLTKETIKQTSSSSNTRVQEYQYNSQNWIKRIIVDDDTVDNNVSTKAEYNFDAMGNRVSINDRKYIYDGMNRMERVGNTDIKYDARGLRLSETTDSKNLSYLYTYDGQLDKVYQSGQLLVDHDYNALGKNTFTRTNDGDNEKIKTLSYDIYGRIIHEDHDVRKGDEYDKRVGMQYDDQGNIDRVVTRTVLGDGDVDTYTQTTLFEIKGDSWQKTLVRMRGSTNRERINNSEWNDGISKFEYATDGSLTKVTKHDVSRGASTGGQRQETLRYTYDVNGQIIDRYSKTENTELADKEKWNDVFNAIEEEHDTKETGKDNAYNHWQEVKNNDESTEEEIKAAKDAYDFALQQYKVALDNFNEAKAAKNGDFEKRVKALRGDAYTPPAKFFYFKSEQVGKIDLTSNKATFDLTYRPTEQSVLSYYRKVTSGESLRTIAEQTYGDASLWYVIANANGLESESVSAGREVLIPQLNDNQSNKFDSFKPYDANEAIGNTDPYLPSAPPPEKSCKDIVIMITAVIAAVIVAALITFATAGVATAAGAAAGAAVGTGIAGTVATVATTVVVGSVIAAGVGAIASSISQGIMIAGGVQEKFDLDELAKSAIMGAAGGFLSSGFTLAAQTAKFAKVAAAASRMGTQVAKAAKLGSTAVKIASKSIGVANNFARGAAVGAFSATAGEAYDAARGGNRRFDADMVLYGAIQGGVGEAGGGIAGKLAVRNKSINFKGVSVSAKIQAGATAGVAAIGSAYIAEGVRSAVYGKKFDALNATLDAIGGGVAAARAFSRESGTGYKSVTNGFNRIAKGFYNYAKHGRKNVVTSFGGNVNDAVRNLSREIGVKAVKPSELGKFNGSISRLVITDHGGFDLNKGEFTVGGRTAKELAADIAFAMKPDMANSGGNRIGTLSLASCSAGSHNLKGSTFANDLYGALSKKGIQVNRINARTNELSVLADSRKVMTDAQNNKVFHADKVIVTSANKGDNSVLSRKAKIVANDDQYNISQALGDPDVKALVNREFLKEKITEKIRLVTNNEAFNAWSGSEIPRNIHRFWAGGKLSDTAMRSLLRTAEASKANPENTWNNILWTSKKVNNTVDYGSEAAPKGLSWLTTSKSEMGKVRDKQFAELKAAGYEIRNADDLKNNIDGFNETIKNMSLVAAKAAKENQWVQVKEYSDFVRLAALKQDGGLYADIDMGLERVDLGSLTLRHNHDDIPLTGTLIRDERGETRMIEAINSFRAYNNENLPFSRNLRSDIDNANYMIEGAITGSSMFNAQIATRPQNPSIDRGISKMIELSEQGSNTVTGMVAMSNVVSPTGNFDIDSQYTVPPYLLDIEHLTADSRVTDE
ncbi:glycosyltransferase [Pleionea sediminis]|uniref:glycosyltransferase n=1 Tax=Pleionea sediminis TaxID=2569479 RepID=UPI001186091E|nr:glycosyltransferase [Pleionea sediminis]